MLFLIRQTLCHPIVRLHFAIAIKADLARDLIGSDLPGEAAGEFVSV